jgi:hypothetical protein
MQLGAVITQDNRPIVFFSTKLSETQTKYSVTKIKLLAILETLKEFQDMLWGQQIKVYTDHKNPIRDALGLTSDRVYRWRLLLEEYAPEIVYIKGIHNTVMVAIPDLSITQKSIQLRSRTLLTLGYRPRAIVGKVLQHYGILITRRTQARMYKTAI